MKGLIFVMSAHVSCSMDVKIKTLLLAPLFLVTKQGRSRISFLLESELHDYVL
jgi:hypothetical protein